jgi:hypothetical protein
MEGHLHVIDSIKEKVTTLKESTGELGAQQDTLSSAVERIELAQTQFTAAAESQQPTPPPQIATNRVATVDRGVMRMMGVKTSSPPLTNSRFLSMMGPTIHYRVSTGASGTSRSAAHWSRSTSLWPSATFSTTRNSGSIGWSSMVAVRPGRSSSN